MPQFKSKYSIDAKKSVSLFHTQTKGKGKMSFTALGQPTRTAETTGSGSAMGKTIQESIQKAETKVGDRISQRLRERLITNDSTSELTLQFKTQTDDLSEPLIISSDPENWVGVIFSESNVFRIYNETKTAGQVKASVLVVGKGGDSNLEPGGAGGGGGGSCYLENITLILSTKDTPYEYEVQYNDDGSVQFRDLETIVFVGCIAFAGQAPLKDQPYIGGIGGSGQISWANDGGQKTVNEGGDGGIGQKPNPRKGYNSSPMITVEIPFYKFYLPIGGGGGGSFKVDDKKVNSGAPGRGFGGGPASQYSGYDPTTISGLNTGYGSGAGGFNGTGGSGIMMLWFQNN